MLLNRKNPIHIREIIIAASLFLVAFILGNIFDFKIGEKIYSLGTPNWFAIIMSAISEIPVIMALALGGCLCIAGRPTNTKKVWTVFSVIIGVLGLCAAAYFTFDTFKYIYQFDHLSNFNPKSENFNNPTILIVAGVVTILMLVGCYFFYKKITPKFDAKTMLIIGIFFLVISISVAAFATALKYLWSRPRPRYVFSTADPASAFHYLYQLSPFYAFKAEVSDNFKSFPSGHTTYATLSLFVLPMLTLLSKKSEDDRKLQIILFYVGLIWVLLVALSRILANAHYLSDVSGAAFICLILVFIEKTILFKLKSKKGVAKA